MPAPESHYVTLPNGKIAVLRAGVGDAFEFTVLDTNGTPRDLTGDTLSVVAKLNTTSKTLTLTKRANQTTTGKGRTLLVIPQAVLDATGTLYADLKVAKTGGEAQIYESPKWSVVNSDAD